MPVEEILSVLWVLVCTVAVLALCYYVTRRLTRLPALSRYAGGIAREGRLEVLSRVPLGKDQSLVVAAVGKRCFLLGCAAGSVSLLTELTEEEAAAWTTRREEKNSTEQRSFRDAMGELLKQKVQRGEHRD